MKKTLFALLLLVAIIGCGRSGPSIQVRRKAVSQSQVRTLMRQAKSKPPASMTAEDYQRARADATESFIRSAVDANTHPASLKRALALITSPTGKNHVLTTRVIQAPFGNRKAWIIVQNWNKPGADLAHVKVWILAVRDQSLLYAASER